jgi:hypothetical protein
MTLKSLIEIDFTGTASQLQDLQRSYTDLGVAVHSVASSVSGDSLDLAAKADGISANVPEDLPFTFPDSQRTLMQLDEWARKERELGITMQTLEGVDLGSVIGDAATAPLPTTVSQVVIPAPQVHAAKRDVDRTFKDAVEAVEKVQKSDEDASKEVSTFSKWAKGEVSDAIGVVKGLLGKIPGNWSGGFMSGLIGTISLGYQEQTRKRAELGEMRSIFTAGVDSVLKGGTERSIREFAKWAEKAQWHYGIARQDTQKAFKTMVDSGFHVGEMKGKFADQLKDAENRVVITSIAFDKHFNFATGTSIKYITDLVTHYGMSLDEANKSYAKMSMAGQRSGMGTDKFLRVIMSSKDTIGRFGINALTLSDMLENLKGYYEDMGLNEQYAGQQAAGVVQDLAQAFMSLDDGMKVFLMQDMYPEEAEQGFHELRTKFMDGLGRLQRGEGDEFYERLVKSYVKFSHQQFGGTRGEKILAIKEQLAVRNPTATALNDLGEALLAGRPLTDEEEKQWENVKNAFKTEGLQVSSLQKTRREMIRGMAMLGKSLVAIVADIFSLMVVGIRGLKAMAWGIKHGQLDMVWKNIQGMNTQLVEHIKESWKFGEDGLTLVGESLGKEFEAVFSPVFDAITKDIDPERVDPANVAKKAVRAAMEGAAGLANEAGDERDRIRAKADQREEEYWDNLIRNAKDEDERKRVHMARSIQEAVTIPFQAPFGFPGMRTQDIEVLMEEEFGPMTEEQLQKSLSSAQQGTPVYNPVTGKMMNEVLSSDQSTEENYIE